MGLRIESQVGVRMSSATSSMLPRKIVSRILEEAAMAIGARLNPAFWCMINGRDRADPF